MLTGAFGAARSGRAAAVLVAGDGGVGKTRLVEELARHARRAGAVVLTGSAVDITDAPPFWPVLSAIRNAARAEPDTDVATLLRQWLTRLPQAGGAGPDAGPPVVLLDLLHQLVVDLAERRPVLLVVDDLQWADRSTRDLVAYLVANLVREPVLVLVTFRTDSPRRTPDLDVALAELRRLRKVTTLDVAPLPRDVLAALVADWAPDRPELPALVWQRSAGNAFIAEETVRAVLGGDAHGLPSTLREIVLSRIALLSPAAQQVVRALATGVGPLRHRLLADVLDLEPATLLAAVREAMVHGAVRVDDSGEGYLLRHGLLAEVVAADLLPGERIELHRRTALALGRDGDPTTPAPPPGSPTTGTRPTTRRGPCRPLPPPRGPRRPCTPTPRRTGTGCAPRSSSTGRAPIREVCAGRTAWTGRRGRPRSRGTTTRPSRCSSGSSTIPRPAQACRRRCSSPARAGRSLRPGGSGTPSGATGPLPRCCPTAARTPSVRRCSPATGPRSCTRWTSRRRAPSPSRRSSSPAGPGRTPSRPGCWPCSGSARPSSTTPRPGRRRSTMPWRSRSGRVSRRPSARRYLRRAELLTGPLNRLVEGVAYARDGVERMRALGLARTCGVALLTHAANALFRLGRWDEAERVVAQTWELGPTGAAALDVRLARCRITLGRGRLDEAAADLEAVELLSRSTSGPRQRIPLLVLFAALELWRRDPARALRHAEDGLALAEAGAGDIWSLAPLVWHGTRAWADLVAAGGPAPAPAQVDRLRRHCAELSLRATTTVPAVRAVVDAFALMCMAETARAEHRCVPEVWERAAGMWERHQQPYPAAYALLRHAEALLERSPRSTAAADVLRAAEGAARQLGAQPLLDDVADLAGRARVPLTEAGPPPPVAPAALTPLDDLTGRELEVLVELAKGFTNREIGRRLYISEKTVGVHLTRIFHKIGVHSRVQASAVLQRSRPALGDR